MFQFLKLFPQISFSLLMIFIGQNLRAECGLNTLHLAKLMEPTAFDGPMAIISSQTQFATGYIKLTYSIDAAHAKDIKDKEDTSLLPKLDFFNPKCNYSFKIDYSSSKIASFYIGFDTDRQRDHFYNLIENNSDMSIKVKKYSNDFRDSAAFDDVDVTISGVPLDRSVIY